VQQSKGAGTTTALAPPTGCQTSNLRAALLRPSARLEIFPFPFCAAHGGVDQHPTIYRTQPFRTTVDSVAGWRRRRRAERLKAFCTPGYVRTRDRAARSLPHLTLAAFPPLPQPLVL